MTESYIEYIYITRSTTQALLSFSETLFRPFSLRDYPSLSALPHSPFLSLCLALSRLPRTLYLSLTESHTLLLSGPHTLCLPLYIVLYVAVALPFCRAGAKSCSCASVAVWSEAPICAAFDSLLCCCCCDSGECPRYFIFYFNFSYFKLNLWTFLDREAIEN